MINYDKVEIKKQLTTDNIYSLLSEWGGNPEYTPFGILSSTICHNGPGGEGSRKLYYYCANNAFKCYTQCSNTVFDIFELTIKVFAIQKNQMINLNDAVRWIAGHFGFSGTTAEIETFDNKDWQIFDNYAEIDEIEIINYDIDPLPEFDKSLLDNFNYQVNIEPWLNEGITKEAMQQARIGYYPGGEQITIPHFDINGRFIGLRGRSLVKDEAELYGKYRPIKINNVRYNHPLGYNLYNLNFSKENIAAIKKAIIVESEKSCLKYKSFYGIDNDITVACCGSGISNYQMKLLLDLGVQEVIIAFDREGEKDDKKKYVSKFYNFNNRFKNDVLLSFVYDKYGEYLGYKDSPLDKDKETFEKLFKRRIIL